MPLEQYFKKTNDGGEKESLQDMINLVTEIQDERVHNLSEQSKDILESTKTLRGLLKAINENIEPHVPKEKTDTTSELNELVKNFNSVKEEASHQFLEYTHTYPTFNSDREEFNSFATGFTLQSFKMVELLKNKYGISTDTFDEWETTKNSLKDILEKIQLEIIHRDTDITPPVYN